MVLTRSATRKIESEHAQTNGGVLHKNTPGNDFLPQAKERQGPLNLDVLLLIAADAHPRDLLNLARTSRYFRELLMDKSSELVWKTARRQFEGLPDCPDDLTEQQYADLAFCARCHGCGEYADTALWEIRRRYCPDCKIERLCCLSSCHEIIQKKYVLGMEHLTIGSNNKSPLWVDREQMESFMDEYMHSSDKQQLLGNKQERLVPIRRHARQCEFWQRGRVSAFRKERDKSIFKRLKQVGYGPEVGFSGRYAIRDSRKSIFDTTKPLTDKEWDRIWPEWLETMNNFRLQRLEKTVYQSRRCSLVNEYDTYVTCPLPNTPAFDLLPHVADVARFPPFRDIIRAPEETQMNDELFESAFAQLPEFVDEWRKKLHTEVAELVQIPSNLSSKDASGDPVVASTNSSQAPTDKLRLACALFQGGSKGVFPYPEVLSTSMCSYKYPKVDESDAARTGSIRERFGIRFMEGAPHIVHICGLDPNVATAEDMDRRNPRLKCLSFQCSNQKNTWSWREAVWHWCSAGYYNHTSWELIRYDTAKEKVHPGLSRCLLCRPRVGDVIPHASITYHLRNHHDVEGEIKQGVHYQLVATQDWNRFDRWGPGV